jgi:hypothetical protein
MEVNTQFSHHVYKSSLFQLVLSNLSTSGPLKFISEAHLIRIGQESTFKTV